MKTGMAKLMEKESVDVTDILAEFPKPWGTESAKGFQLTPNGHSALLAILLLHEDCVAVDAAQACAIADDERGLWLLAAEGAGRFVKTHQEHSCVPGIPAGGLCILMALFQLECEFKGGRRDQLGNPIH